MASRQRSDLRGALGKSSAGETAKSKLVLKTKRKKKKPKAPYSAPCPGKHPKKKKAAK